ncbi:MAG: pilus assembly protein TadG-related protein [Gemmatimonadota bacterium]|nr:pilus assembly protein TadG-related protein [Gemmatimonadota bacterium]
MRGGGRWYRLGDESGAVTVFVAISLVVLLSCLALGVDTGLLMTARTESQQAADAAALAGAGVLARNPADSVGAHATALDWTSRNLVRGMQVHAGPSDVVVDLDAATVQVTVHNTAARGNPVPTMFARIIGQQAVDIATTATAEAAPAASVACPLPLALPDRWIDNGDGRWNPAEDLYRAWPDANHTGYGEDHIGERIQIKTSPGAGGGAGREAEECGAASNFDPCNGHASWNCWWREDPPNRGGSGGVAALSDLIHPGCTVPDAFSSVLDEIWAASGSGNKQSLVSGAMRDLVDSDPHASWDDTRECVSRNGECVTDSPRIRAMPIVRPDQISGGGANVSAPIHTFTGVFVEKVSCGPDMPHGSGPAGQWNVYVRLMGTGGFGAVGRPGGNAPLVRTVRLIR